MHANSPPQLENSAPLTRRWRGRWSVSLLSLLCLVSLVLGVLLLLGASAPPETAAPTPSTDTRMSKQARAQEASARDALPMLKAGDIPVLMSMQARQELLAEREHKVTEREKQLAMRDADLGLVQKQIEEKLTMLTTLRKEMGEILQEQAAFEKKRFAHLVKVYEVMKPAEVSSLMARLNEDTAVRLLYQMQEKKVGKILAALAPEVAAKLSERLAVYRQQETPPPPAKEKP